MASGGLVHKGHCFKFLCLLLHHPALDFSGSCFLFRLWLLFALLLSLIKDYNQRPKYLALRKTKLFLAYDRKPYDVGDWYRTVRLNPNIGDGSGVGGGRHTPISPASSTVTLSPDGNRSAHGLNGSELDVTAARRGSGGSTTQQRETSLTRRSPAPSTFIDSPPAQIWRDAVGGQKPTMLTSKSLVLPPSGASSVSLRHTSPTPPLGMQDNITAFTSSGEYPEIAVLSRSK